MSRFLQLDSPAERELYPAMLELLKYRQIPAKRNQCGMLHVGNRWINLGASGWPDLIGCLPGSGRFLGVEAKLEGEEPSEVQRERLAEIRAAGGLIVVVQSLQDLQTALREELGR